MKKLRILEIPIQNWKKNARNPKKNTKNSARNLMQPAPGTRTCPKN